MALQTFYPKIGANDVIRRLIDTHLEECRKTAASMKDLEL